MAAHQQRGGTGGCPSPGDKEHSLSSPAGEDGTSAPSQLQAAYLGSCALFVPTLAGLGCSPRGCARLGTEHLQQGEERTLDVQHLRTCITSILPYQSWVPEDFKSTAAVYPRHPVAKGQLGGQGVLATHQRSAGNLRPVSPCMAGWEGGCSRSLSAQHGGKENPRALKLKEEERVVAGEVGGWGQFISGDGKQELTHEQMGGSGR